MKRGTAARQPVVMHLIDTGGPGGAETVFSQLASAVGKGKVRPLAVVPREHWLSGQLRSVGLEPTILNARGSLNYSYFSVLAKMVRQQQVQLIHTHLLGSAVYGALVGLITRVPVISVFHGPTDLRQVGRFAGAKRWLINHGCSAIVAVSSSTHDALVQFGMPAERITLIQNGIDTELYHPGSATDLRHELGLGNDDLLIAAVGNIRVPKAYDVLLKSAASVLAQVPRACFAVIGEGDEKQLAPLLELRRSLGIEARFHFLGFRKSTASLFQNVDVFVSSSRTEGLSLSFLEAMATGRAIVATRSGGAQEALVDRQSGLLVPTEDPPALAHALIEILSSPGLRIRLGAAARERVVRDFSLQGCVAKYQALYDRLIPA
jgi:glycosyltransferase involved in cell wall biosynthesis